MELTREEKLYLKTGKVLLEKFLSDLGKELEDEKFKENVYSFLEGLKVGMSLKGYEKNFFLALGTIFGYVFSDILKKYEEKV